MINDTAREEKAIHIVIDKFETAWNTHNATAFALTFSADADFTNAFGEKLQGRQVIEEFHATTFATIFKESQLTVTEIRIRFISIDVAGVDVVWEMSGALSSGGEPADDGKGLINLIMKHENGTWSILLMHNMNFPAMPLSTF